MELGRASIDRVQARLKLAFDKGLSTSVKFQDSATPDDQYRWTPADHRRRGLVLESRGSLPLGKFR